MKNEREIYKERLEIEKKRIKLMSQLQTLKKNLENLQNECDHHLVLAYNDNTRHTIGPIYRYCCPTCGKRLDTYIGYKIEKSAFRNSKVIDLTSLPLDDFYNNFDWIINFIFTNYDYCYYNNSENEVAKFIINHIKTYNDSKVLKK